MLVFLWVSLWKERTEKNGLKIIKRTFALQEGRGNFSQGKKNVTAKREQNSFMSASGLEGTQPTISRDLGSLWIFLRKRGGNYLSEMT